MERTCNIGETKSPGIILMAEHLQFTGQYHAGYGKEIIPERKGGTDDRQQTVRNLYMLQAVLSRQE